MLDSSWKSAPLGWPRIGRRRSVRAHIAGSYDSHLRQIIFSSACSSCTALQGERDAFSSRAGAAIHCYHSLCVIAGVHWIGDYSPKIEGSVETISFHLYH